VSDTGPRRGRWRSRATAVSLVLLPLALVACQPPDSVPRTGGGHAGRVVPMAQEPGDTATDRDVMQAETVVPETARTEDGASKRRDDAASNDAPATTAPQETARRPPAPVDPDPDRIRGATPAAVRARLGAPQWQRHEATARLWQFRTTDCVLDVVFYPDAEGLHVSYLEARHRRDGTPLPLRACLTSLLERQRDGRAATG